MTRDDIIRMAKESGLDSILDDWLHEFTPGNWPETDIQELDHFVALVAAAEREKVAAWMRSKSYATGHGDTIEDLLKELEWQVAEREREACVELCLEHSKLNVDDANVEFSHLASYEFGKQVGAATCATAIRARGEA